MKSFLLYALVLPTLVMIALGMVRVRFALYFWRRMYLAGLIYVAIVLVRLVWVLTVG